MEKVHYYYIMKNQCIEKISYDIDAKVLFSDIKSIYDEWNLSNYEKDE